MGALPNRSYRQLKAHDTVVAQNPTVLHTADQVGQLIQKDHQRMPANGAHVIFIGDEHTYGAGHDAITNLMSTLTDNGVKTLVVEMGADQKGFLKDLQKDIREQHLTEDQIFKRLTDGGFSADATGGDQRLKDMAKLIKAATDKGLRVTACDERTDETQAKLDELQDKAQQLVEKYKKHPDKKTREALEAVQKEWMEADRSKDARTAFNIMEEGIHAHGAPVAVMYGAAHGCLGTQSVVSSLINDGVTVTSITAVSPALAKTPLPAGECPIANNTVLDTSLPGKDLKNKPEKDHQQPDKHHHKQEPLKTVRSIGLHQ